MHMQNADMATAQIRRAVMATYPSRSRCSSNLVRLEGAEMARQARGTRSEYAVIRPHIMSVRIETRRLALVRHITDSQSDSMNDEIALRRTEIRRSTTGQACYTSYYHAATQHAATQHARLWLRCSSCRERQRRCRVRQTA